MFEYKYHPIYKYIALTIAFLLYMIHYDRLDKEKYIITALIFGLLIYIVDYMMIQDHPPLVIDDEHFSNKTKIDDNISEIINQDLNISTTQNNNTVVDTDITELNKQIYLNQIKLQKIKDQQSINSQELSY